MRSSQITKLFVNWIAWERDLAQYIKYGTVIIGPLNGNTSDKVITESINFFSKSFDSTPKIIIGFQTMDISPENKDDIRACCSPKSITKDSFQIQVETWLQTIIFKIKIVWIAVCAEWINTGTLKYLKTDSTFSLHNALMTLVMDRKVSRKLTNLVGSKFFLTESMIDLDR